MKHKLWTLVALLGFMMPLYATAPQDTLDTLKLAEKMIDTSVYHIKKEDKSTQNARDTYDRSKKGFLIALNKAIKQNKDPKMISGIVANCFQGMAQAWQAQMTTSAVSKKMCDKVGDKYRKLVFSNFATLTQAPQTPVIKATKDYMGCKALSLCLHAHKLFSEKKEALVYRKESAYLLTAATALSR